MKLEDAKAISQDFRHKSLMRPSVKAVAKTKFAIELSLCKDPRSATPQGAGLSVQHYWRCSWKRKQICARTQSPGTSESHTSKDLGE